VLNVAIFVTVATSINAIDVTITENVRSVLLRRMNVACQLVAVNLRIIQATVSNKTLTINCFIEYDVSLNMCMCRWELTLGVYMYVKLCL